MSDFTTDAVNTEVQSQVGPNMNGTGGFHVNTGGDRLSVLYTPKGDARVLYGIDNQRPEYELPQGRWVTFSSGIQNVYFSFTAAEGSGNDFKVSWNLS